MEVTKDKRPNDLLRYEREKRGWSQARLAEIIDADASMVSRWERGDRKPDHIYREKLCKLFEKDAVELGFVEPVTVPHTPHQLTEIRVEDEEEGINMANTDQLSFGSLQTTWVVVDGDGTCKYHPRNIRTYFDPHAQELPADLFERRNQIEKLHVSNRQQGLPFQWNGERYSLDRFILSRDGNEEDLALDLWFKPSDYYTFLATNMALDDATLREKYLRETDWNQPVPFFSNSFGVYLLVVTSDHFTLLSQRSRGLGSRPGEYNISVCEGLSRSDAGRELAPDIYCCTERGITEELGLSAPHDFNSKNVIFLSFGVDTRYSQWCLLGIVKVYKTAQEIINYRKAGVKDRLENAKIHTVKFDLDAIIPFVFSHAPWAPGGLACLYHSLVYEFGRSRLEETLVKYLRSAT